MRSSSAANQALENDDLLNCILDSIVDGCLSDDCANSVHAQPKRDADDPCIHDQIVARFLSVSKQWFRLAVPYYWREADLNQLSVLIEASRENGYVTPLTLKRWQLYSRFVCTIIMNGIPKKQRLHPEKIDCLLPIIELLGFIPQGQMLLPNAHTMLLGPRWCSTRGSQGLASLLLSPAIQTVQTAFNAGLTSTIQVSIYFETLVQKTGQLQSLRVLYQERFATGAISFEEAGPPHGFDSRFGVLLSPNVRYPGNLSAIKHINVQIYIDSNAYSYPRIRTRMFPALERLTITAELAIIGGIVTSYLSKSTPAGSLLKGISIPSPLSGLKQEGFLFLAELSPSLNEIRLNGQGDSVFSEHHLMHIARCRNLTLLKVESIDNYLPYIRKDKFRDVMAGLRNLKCLHLTRGRYPAYLQYHLPSSPSQIPTTKSSGPDLTYLEMMAEGLPQLESLWITLDACDTSQFNLDHIVNKFDALKELHFSTPFLNWRISSFDTQRAVNYIISLLQTRTKFTCDPVIYMKTSRPTGEWAQFIAEYNTFIDAFERQVLDGIKELYTLSDRAT